MTSAPPAPLGPVPPRVVVVGSVNMDLVLSVPRIARPGETVLAREPRYLPGGKGANQAVAAARTGADVAFVARTGADGFGVLLRASLESAGVDVSRVLVVPDVPSGVAVVVVDDDGENAITVAPGANGAIGPTDLRKESGVLDRASLAVVQLEVPIATVTELAAMCVRAGLPLMLNAAPFHDLPPEVVRACDYLVVNRDEATALTGVQVDSTADAQRAAERAVTLGARHVIVTLGAGGCVAVTAHEVVTVSAVEVELLDSTGAGDAFVGALAVAISQGRDLVDALVFASAAGAIVCTTSGAQTPMLSAAAVHELVTTKAPDVQVVRRSD